MIAVLLQSTAPTARAVRWLPLAGVGVAMLVAATLADSAAGPVETVLLVCTAALAAAAVAALHDPAVTLLAAVPTSLVQRQALRLLLVGVPALVVWTAVAELTSGATVEGLGRLLALTSTGLAVAVSVHPHARGVLVGASAPAAWFALDRLAPLDGLPGDAAGWWRTDPWPVVAVMLLACVVRRRS